VSQVVCVLDGCIGSVYLNIHLKRVGFFDKVSRGSL